MANLPPVVLELQANAGKLKSALDGASKDIEKMSKDGASHFDQLSAAAGEFATATGAAMTAAGAALQKIAGPMEQSRALLKQAVENTGNDFDVFAGQIDNAIGKQEHFGHSAADTQSALQKMTAAFNDPKRALDDMSLAADIAAAKHISLADAAGLIVKMSSGSGRVFKEFGINLADYGGGAAGAASATEVLRQRLSGMADAASDTTQGKLQSLRAHLTDIAGTIGEKLAPVLMTAGPLLMGLGQAAPIIGKLKSVLVSTGEEGAAAISGLGLAAGAVGIVLGGLALITMGFAADAAKARKNVDDLRESMDKYGDTVGQAAARSVEEFTAKHKDAADAMARAGITTDDLTKALTGNGDAYKQMHKHLEEQILDAQRNSTINADYIVGLRELITKIDDTAKASQSLTEQDKAQADAQAKINDTLPKTVDTTNELVKARQDAADVGAVEAEKAKLLNDRYAEQARQAKDAAARQDALAKAIQGVYDTTQSVLDPTLHYHQALRDVADGSDDVKAKIEDSKKAVKEHGEKSAEAAKAGRELQAAQEGLVEKLKIASQNFATQAGDVEGSRKAYDDQIASLQELRKNFGTELGPADELLQAFMQHLEQAAAHASNLAANAHIIEGGGAGYGNVDEKGNKIKGPAFALGGWVPGGAGQPLSATVHGSEYVLSTDMLAGRQSVDPGVLAALGAGMGGPSMSSSVFNFNGDVIVQAPHGADPAVFGAQIMEALKALVRQNGMSTVGTPVLVP